MIVLALAQNTVHFILLYLIESDQSVAALLLDCLCEDSIFVITTECVHEDVRLGRGHMHATLAALDLATLDLGVVAFSDFESWS